MPPHHRTKAKMTSSRARKMTYHFHPNAPQSHMKAVRAVGARAPTRDPQARQVLPTRDGMLILFLVASSSDPSICMDLEFVFLLSDVIYLFTYLLSHKLFILSRFHICLPNLFWNSSAHNCSHTPPRPLTTLTTFTMPS